MLGMEMGTTFGIMGASEIAFGDEFDAGMDDEESMNNFGSFDAFG